MRPAYFIGWHLFRVVFATYFRWRVCNPERVPAEGAVILAANHASFLDPPVVGVGLRRPIHYLARESLLRFPVIRTLLYSWNAVPVDRDGGGAKGLRNILDRLVSGGGIVMFPEGTRTHDGELQFAHSGIGLIVIKSIAPVVPVRTFGTYEALGRRDRFPRPYKIAVKYGKPIMYENLRKEAATCSKIRKKEIYQEVAADIMTQIGSLEPVTDKIAFP